MPPNPDNTRINQKPTRTKGSIQRAIKWIKSAFCPDSRDILKRLSCIKSDEPEDGEEIQPARPARRSLPARPAQPVKATARTVYDLSRELQEAVEGLGYILDFCETHGKDGPNYRRPPQFFAQHRPDGYAVRRPNRFSEPELKELRSKEVTYAGKILSYLYEEFRNCTRKSSIEDQKITAGTITARLRYMDVLLGKFEKQCRVEVDKELIRAARNQGENIIKCIEKIAGIA